MCDKCFTFIENQGTPKSGVKCPEGSYYTWKDLGVVGNINYQCDKCNEMIKSQSSPKTGIKCSAGSYHSWKKL